MMALNVTIFGPPGAGKGTQAERFARASQIPKISTGDILREAVASGTELGKRAKAVMESGSLVGDDLMIEIVRARLQQADAQRGFVLDGFPRTIAQAVALDQIVAGRSPLIIVQIVVPEDEVVRRLGQRRTCQACGTPTTIAEGIQACPRCGGQLVLRPDDAEPVVRERLRVYARETQPLVDFYRSRPTFRSIDGAQPPERVAADLAEAIDSAASGQADRAAPMKGRV